MNDYVFRGITQSNHKPSVARLLRAALQRHQGPAALRRYRRREHLVPEPRRGRNRLLRRYPPDLRHLRLRLRRLGLPLSGRTCFNAAAFPGSGIPGSDTQCVLNGILPLNGNVAKKNASFFEVYGKVNITVNDQFTLGLNEYYSPNFLNLGAWGNYASITGKWTAPSTTFGASGLGMYISGEFGRQWLGTSDAFYGVVSPLANFAAGIPEPSYNTWNVGIGFTYKVFTLDLRYSDTNLSKASCNAFTSDHTTTNFNPAFVTAINPGGFGSNWCGATGIVKLSADLTAASNLK